jgi:uncharacterized membrane protein required for colicin V production
MLNKRVVIFVLSIIGAILVSYNIGFLLNMLGNFFDMVERIKAGEKMEDSFYGFLAFACILAVSGVFYQMKKLKAVQESSEQDDNTKNMYLN